MASRDFIHLTDWRGASIINDGKEKCHSLGSSVAGVFVCGRSSVVERQLPKLNVDGSSPFARSLTILLSSCQVEGLTSPCSCWTLRSLPRRLRLFSVYSLSPASTVHKILFRYTQSQIPLASQDPELTRGVFKYVWI